MKEITENHYQSSFYESLILRRRIERFKSGATELHLGTKVLDFEDIIIRVKMKGTIYTSIEGIQIQEAEIMKYHVSDIEIVDIQNKEQEHN